MRKDSHTLQHSPTLTHNLQHSTHIHPHSPTLIHTLPQMLPHEATTLSATLHGLVLVLMGVVITWAAPCCNSPVFAEIVPPSLRNLVYAFDRSFEM